MGWGWAWKPYVSVAERREKARREMGKLHKKGVLVQPVEIEGRKIARTFWGESWCKHLESFSDYENRLPRGRAYVRNGSVCHLEIASGEVKAKVSGSELYDVKISIQKLARSKWTALKERCSGQIGSILELLKGKLSNSVMSVVTDRKEGLFPLPAEIKLECSCPDWASMCKHVAAVLYGVGSRLDNKPELLFHLRGVDHEELIMADAAATASITRAKGAKAKRFVSGDLEDLFGIEMLADDASDNGRHGRTVEKEKSAKGTSTKGNSGKEKSANETSPNKMPRRRDLVREEKIGIGSKSTRAEEKKSANKMTSQSKENSSRQRTSTVKIAPATNAGTGRTLTGESVRDLRARLDMSCVQLASLIGVSAASVSNWEKETGQLKLQARNMSALRAATKLTKRSAWNRLSDI